MDRNREARRGNNMAAPPNGLSSSRRRHRSTGLRDSPDEDGGMEVQEPGRLRDRGVVKKDRDRDRERDRERNRSKRRRENRMMSHHNRDDGEDTSEESVNDEEEDDEDAGNGGGLRMLPPPPANQASASNHHSHNHSNNNPYSQPPLHRKSFPSSGNNKVFRASGSPAAPLPAWKAADEMIGVSVPRKARSASTKRSHEWTSGGGAIGGTGTESIHRQSSTSPAPEAPLSPSSSNVSVRKKLKANGSSKPRPPKSLSKSSSSNPEELEIEIAEVLYGLMTQSQAPSKKEVSANDSTAKFDSNKSSETKSTSLSTIAPKRKRPRQVSENPFSVRNSPVSSSMKTEADHHHHQQHQSPKTDISSPYLENSSPASTVAAENGSFGFTALPGHQAASTSSEPAAAGEEVKTVKCGVGVGVVLTKEEAENESPAVGPNDGNNNNNNNETVITTAASMKTTDPKAANQEIENKKEEKFEIDLMAPPPQQRTSQENDGEMEFSNLKQNLPETSKSKEDQKPVKPETLMLKSGIVQETGESSKREMNDERKLDLRLDFEKPNKDSVNSNSNRSLHQALKHQQLSTKSETQEKTGQPSSLPIPVPVANWPPMGYVAPLQGVISMDGNAMSSAPVQPLFTHPRPKRCATHCYIARNIHYLQQFMKINPFWPPASASAAPMFGSKPSTELQSHVPQSMQDKSQQVGIFPGQTTVKDTKSSQTASVPDPRKQQVLLQQAMPPVTPNNILHGPAFIFPFNQQQAAAAAAASVRPGPKLSTSTATGVSGAAANTAAVSSSATPAAVPALSFNYPNMSANDTQYLAIVQNHPYAFPMPAVGGPPNYRANHPHPQAMPLFNGSFYSSQMIHPSQIPQPPQSAPPPSQPQQTHQNSSGSTSSSQKHLQGQQRQQGSSAGGGAGTANGGGLHSGYPAAHKSRSQQMNPPPQAQAQARHLENEVTGGEDSPSTADSRVSRAGTSTIGVYGHNFAMPVHTQNFALMTPSASASSADKKPQQVLKRVGAESSSLQPPQTFAMSFAPMNGAQNHAMFQNLPESVRQGYHHMMTSSAVSASAHHSEPKKDFRITEEASRTTTGHDSSNLDDDRKLPAKSGQSIAFSRPDHVNDTSGSSAAAISANSMSLGSNTRSTRSPIPTSASQSSHHLHAQFQQQQVLQLQKHHQQNQNQNMNTRTKNPNQPPSSNGTGSPYPDHLITSSSSMATKFPNSLSSFPLQTGTTNSSSVQSPQWRNSIRGPTSSPTTSSLKNLHQTQQQQSSRSQVSHTQISFGASQKLQPTPSTQMQPQQQQNQNPNSNNSASPPMLVASPTSSLSSQPPKNTQISSPSILGNPHNSNVNKSQQQQQQQQHQLHKQQLQQQQQQQQQRAYAQMMFTHPNMQVQQPPGQQHSVGSTPASGYYLPRKQQQSAASSTAMLSLSPPMTLTSTTTSDPAKAIAAATSNLKGGVGLVSQQGVLHAAQYGGGAVAAAAQSSMPAGFSYVHNPPPAAVQVKPAEQKQPAGNDNLRTWQPEK